jgi:hypothetical protein
MRPTGSWSRPYAGNARGWRGPPVPPRPQPHRPTQSRSAGNRVPLLCSNAITSSHSGICWALGAGHPHVCPVMPSSEKPLCQGLLKALGPIARGQSGAATFQRGALLYCEGIWCCLAVQDLVRRRPSLGPSRSSGRVLSFQQLLSASVLDFGFAPRSSRCTSRNRGPPGVHPRRASRVGLGALTKWRWRC